MTVRSSTAAASDRSAVIRVRILLVTFGILAMELTTIRWMSQQIRMFAYLSNVILMAAFLGMGLGVGLGRRSARLFHWTLPSYLLLAGILCYARQLKLMSLSFPDLAIATWGGAGFTAQTFVGTLLVVLAMFLLVTWCFLCAGTLLGDLFKRVDPLRAYSADLLGSLLGVIALTIVSALATPPPVWLALACIPLAFLSRTVQAWISLAGILIFGALSIQGASFSPYNRLELGRLPGVPGAPLGLAANRDYHQILHDLSLRHLSDPSFSAADRRRLATSDYMYRLPFLLSSRKSRALVVGAGTGNDVAAAKRSGFLEVVSVDIDPVIIQIGKRLHPERPYSRPGVQSVVNDARAYFEQHRDERFDVVCFGLLDSHAMFSAMSSLRLDNYVYTVDSLRSAWNLVAPGGLMSISFSSSPGDWISDRIYTTIFEATGQRPVVFDVRPEQARSFIVGKGVQIAPLAMRLPLYLQPNVDVENTRITTDDWPFLYMRPGVFPFGYVAVLCCILIIAAVATSRVFGSSILTRGRFDWTLFFMGAAFLLIETRGVTYLALLFGSTWLVNSAVFAGVLLTVLLVNTLVQKLRPERLDLFWVLLFITLLLTYAIGPHLLLRLPLLLRGIVGGLLNAAPIGCAGFIFSSLLARASDPASALGSNLVGAIVGGCLEYLSIAIGLRALVLLTLALYLTAYFLSRTMAAARQSLAPAGYAELG